MGGYLYSLLITEINFLPRAGEDFARRLWLTSRLLSTRKEKHTTESTENTEETSVASVISVVNFSFVCG